MVNYDIGSSELNGGQRALDLIVQRSFDTTNTGSAAGASQAADAPPSASPTVQQQFGGMTGAALSGMLVDLQSQQDLYERALATASQMMGVGLLSFSR